MSTGLLDAPAETQLASPPQPTRAILLSYTDETITRLIAETKAVNATCDLKTIGDTHWRLVKVRTGLEAKKLEMTEPWRKQVEDVNAEAKRLTALAAPEEKRLKLLLDAKQAEEARLEKARLQQRYETRLFRLEDAGLSLSEGEIRALNEEQFETVFLRLADTKRRQDEAEAQRKRDADSLAQARRELAEKQAELNRQAAALAEQQRQIDEQKRQQAQTVSEQERLVQAAEALPLHPAPALEPEPVPSSGADPADLPAATDDIADTPWREAIPGDESGITIGHAASQAEAKVSPVPATQAATELGKPGAAVTPALPPTTKPATSPPAAPAYNAYSETGFSATREVLARRTSGTPAPPLTGDVAKIRRLADQVRLIAYPVVESERARQFIQQMQFDMVTIAEACDAYHE